VWRLSCLCGCSGSQSVCAESSNDGTSSVSPFAEKPATAIQQVKASLEGGA